jgi:hypothetical protein
MTVLRHPIAKAAFILLFGLLCAAVGAKGYQWAMKRSERHAILPTAQPMNVSVSLNKKHACSGDSPEIAVRQIPASANRIEVKLTDLNFLFEHGGGTVAVPSNGIIAEGALTEYFGPCPDEGEHTYRYRVNALNDEGKIVGIAEIALPCCSHLPE